MTAKIITEHVYPPIPWRGNDWSAHREGDDEETMRVGWGETKEKAVADLLLLEADAEDEGPPSSEAASTLPSNAST